MAMEKQAKAVYGTALQARPLYLQAMADYKKSKGEAVYPDANSSLRITFGTVKGYTKLDGSVQQPFTTNRWQREDQPGSTTTRRRCSTPSPLPPSATAAWPASAWAPSR